MPLRRLYRLYIDIPALRPGTVGAYALACVSAAAATALRVAIDPYVSGVQFITFFPAIMITSLISGFGAGLCCVLLTAVAAIFFVMPPHVSFYVEHPAQVLDLLIFILVALANVIIIAGMRFTIERYWELNRKLEQRSTALRQSQEQLAATVAELQHRTRNLISVIGAIADRTLRTSNSFEDFRASFQGRLGVLGRAQGLLSEMKEGRVTLDELLNTELAAHPTQVGQGSVTLDGPKGVRLRSRMVQPLAMAIHELTTNAIKYGALKQPNGHLTIRWRLETSRESGKPWLHLDWKESGVALPASDARPKNTGQGRELIERLLRYQFGAQTTYAIEADGVHCTISLPASEH